MSPGNGDATQGIDSVFDQDTPHSNVAWLRCELPNGTEVGIPDPDTKNNPPTGLTGIYECQLGDIYNASGSVTSSGQLLTNPADVIAFGCVEIRRYPIRAYRLGQPRHAADDLQPNRNAGLHDFSRGRRADGQILRRGRVHHAQIPPSGSR
jgi:hypothetical protein